MRSQFVFYLLFYILQRQDNCFTFNLRSTVTLSEAMLHNELPYNLNYKLLEHTLRADLQQWND